MKPKISVIIPAYNEEKLLGKCIEALQHQTLPKKDYEIIVVDNNSKDTTFAVAKNYGVTVLSYKKMQRVAGARQHGASYAQGDILAFMDADSFAKENWLEEIVKHFEKDKLLVAVCGVALPKTNAHHIRFGFSIFNQFSRLNQFLGMVLPWGFNFAIRKSAFDQIGGYNLELKTYDDAEMGMRIKRVFGRKSIYYSQKLHVYTSTRKQESLKIWSIYMIDTVRNFTNVVILKRTNTAEIRNIR